MGGQLRAQGFLPVLLGIAWLWGNVHVLQVVQGKNVCGVPKKVEGHQGNQWGWSFVLSVLLKLRQLEAPASACVFPSQWQKHHDNPHELGKQEGREGRGGLGAITDHNSLRVKRKRRRPAKTECPSPAHRGDSHEEGTLGNGSGFLQGQAA